MSNGGRLYYGSIENEIKERQAKRQKTEAAVSSSTVEEEGISFKDAISRGKASGNINISDEAAEVQALQGSSLASLNQNKKLMLQLEAKRKARLISVPTNDLQVRIRLRKYGGPITLFGEGAPDRRERLRAVMIEKEMQKVEAKLKGDKGKGASSAASTKKKKKADQKDKDKQKAFFAEVANADELIHTRRKIATFSLARAKERIAKEKAVRESRQSVNDEKSDNDKKDSDDNVKEETDSSSKNGGDENEKSTYKNMDTSDSNDNDTTNDNNDDENQSQTTSHINSVDVDVLEYRAHKHLLNTLQTYQNYSSEIGDLRPISSVKFSPDSSYLLTSSWSGDSKLWNIPDGQHLATLKGHTERVTDIQWHPRAGVSQGRDSVNIASCGVDRRINLYALPEAYEFSQAYVYASEGESSDEADESDSGMKVEDATDDDSDDAAMLMDDEDKDNETESSAKAKIRSRKAKLLEARKRKESKGAPCLRPMASLVGHTDRISRLCFHPMGRYVFSSCYDKTWRMWDLTTQQQLLLQPGHSRAVFGLAVHPDGSMLATGDTGGIAKLWDLRTGKAVLNFTGHALQVLDLAFHHDGFTMASASDDPIVKIWDLRQRKAVYTVAAHSKTISRVRFSPLAEQKDDVDFYDSNATANGSSNGHAYGHGHAQGNGMRTNYCGMDDGGYLVTSSYDCSVKLWSCRDYSNVHQLNGHIKGVMSVDVSNDRKWIASSGLDRTWKLWSAFED